LEIIVCVFGVDFETDKNHCVKKEQSILLE